MNSVIDRPLGLAAVAVFVPLISLAMGILAGIPFLDGFLFGALLAGYLWLCHGVRAFGRLLALVAVSGAAFHVALMSAIELSAAPELFGWFDSGGPGPGPTPYFAAGILGGAILSSMFVVILPRRSSSKVMLRDVAICSGAGGALGLVGAVVTRQTMMIATHLPLFILWQSGMAFVMAMIAERSAPEGEVRKRSDSVPAVSSPDPLSGASLALFRAMVVLSVLVFTWMVVRDGQAEASNEEEARKHAAWLAEAPPRENLPPLRQQPLDTMFVSNIAWMKMEGEGSVRLERDPPGAMPGKAKPPDFLTYYAPYGPDGGSVTILQFPTRAWARYEARHLVGVALRAVDDQHVLDSSGFEYYWLSEDKVIRIGGRPPELKALVRVYLPKYPSEIDAAFPLFNPRRP